MFDNKIYSATVQMLANALNKGQLAFKGIITDYNKEAEQSDAGQIDLFGGGVLTKEVLLSEILEKQGYGRSTATISEEQQGKGIKQRGKEADTSKQGDGEAGGTRETRRRGERSEEKSESEQIAEAEKEVDLNPSEAQKKQETTKKDM